LECLQHIASDASSLTERIDACIEGLIVAGDFLELADVTTSDVAAKGTWIFAALPSYVVRPSGSVFLAGVVPDQDTFLPQSLASRVINEGFTRLILPSPDEDLAGELREQGLHQLSEGAWLRSPRSERPDEMLSRFKRLVAKQSPSGTVKDIQILDPTRPVTYYRGRWIIPERQSGTFVARRPQEFGAPIWCFVVVESGITTRLLDLPGEESRWRACDVAWHLQMAIDYCRRNPQRYRRRAERDGIRFDFFSPLPQWSERRLMIFGRALARESSLMSYRLSPVEAQTEERFLQERLWLSRTDDSS
jgi:hypothetical protein